EETLPNLFNNDKKILEINSKTGLYPLYVAYSFYQNRRINKEHNRSKEEIRDYWQETLKENIYVICKTKMAKTITKRTLAGYNNYDVNIIDYEDIVDVLKNKPQQFIDKALNGKTWGNEVDKMKFDCIVGNPPYQENDMGIREEGASINSSASPLYDKFTVNAQKITNQYVSLIMPSRWMAGGKGLDNFRRQMLEDTKIKKLFDYPSDGQVFENVSIKGGVCYFLWDNKYNDKCKITINNKDGIVVSDRFLNDGESGVFIRDNELISINKKVWNKTKVNIENSVASIISSRKPYGLATDTIMHPTKYGLSKVYSTKKDAIGKGIKEEEIIELIGLLKNTRVIKYVDKEEIKVGLDTIDKYKIFVPKAYGCGAIGEVIPTPILGTPIQICTETFLRYGCFDKKEDAESALKYLKTKFFRCLVGINKLTQDSPNRVYKNVPIQDFTNNSNIDWTKSITEIDKQLYEKYKLNEAEIEFIETRIKEMK
ncbi:MAG: Eco57I restriction-modification methylase domain-containing protein, partial [Bacilli bacterium]|nr:Eco57I restriction-modification methylase domain-containing protein [Bacilli bacterium]